MSALLNERALELADDGTTEVLRNYAVTIEKPDVNGQWAGETCSYVVTVALRDSHQRAANRPAESYIVKCEAARRAIKCERREFHTPDDRALYADPELVVLTRPERIVPARTPSRP